MIKQNVFGIVGWKNTGKTTLVVSLVKEFRRRGLRVSTIKHAHHEFDIDVPGKDSHRHRSAGAGEVLVSSGKRWALMHENSDDRELGLEELLRHLAPCDLVLIEGFKGEGTHPKIEAAWNREGDFIADRDPSILAIVSNVLRSTPGRRVFGPDDIAGLADFVLSNA